MAPTAGQLQSPWNPTPYSYLEEVRDTSRHEGHDNAVRDMPRAYCHGCPVGATKPAPAHRADLLAAGGMHLRVVMHQW